MSMSLQINRLGSELYNHSHDLLLDLHTSRGENRRNRRRISLCMYDGNPSSLDEAWKICYACVQRL